MALAAQQARRPPADVQTFTLDHFVQGVVEWDIFGELHAEANGKRREREKQGAKKRKTMDAGRLVGSLIWFSAQQQSVFDFVVYDTPCFSQCFLRSFCLSIRCFAFVGLICTPEYEVFFPGLFVPVTFVETPPAC